MELTGHDRRLAENAAAVSSAVHDDKRFKKYYYAIRDNISGFPGIWSFCGEIGAYLTRLEDELGGSDGFGEDWIEIVLDVGHHVLVSQAWELDKKLMAKIHGIVQEHVGLPLDTQVVATHGRWRVVLDYIGEGNDGDYDPSDPDDIPLVRFSLEKKSTSGAWEAVDDTSYCTQVSARTPIPDLKIVAKALLAHFRAGVEAGSSLKKVGERLSWMTLEKAKKLAAVKEAKKK